MGPCPGKAERVAENLISFVLDLMAEADGLKETITYGYK